MSKPHSLSIVSDEAVDRLTSREPVFAQIREEIGLPPAWARKPGFVSLCQMILEQQVSLASAKAHFDKLTQYAGELTPPRILSLTDQELRSCHISRQKSRYLRGLAEALEARRLDLAALPNMPTDQARAQLTALKGIGPWTSDVYLMLCLQAADIFPIGDVALVNAVRHFFGELRKEDILLLSEKWQPYRSLATFFFWHHYLTAKGRQDEMSHNLSEPTQKAN